MSAKGSPTCGSIDSSVTSGWRGIVSSSLVALFGDGGEEASIHAVRACLVSSQSIKIPSTLIACVNGGDFSTTSTYRSYVTE